MNCLLLSRIWPSFLASSGVDPCDVPFRYASGPTPCDCPVARPPRLSEQARDGGQARPSNSRSLRSVPQAGSQFRGLATAIHETSGLVRSIF
jgi:hypothetical protein